MAQRILWSFVFLSMLLFIIGELRNLWSKAIERKVFLLIFLSSLMLGVNQFGFVFAISTRQVVQASFAYYIFPIIAVFLGFVVLKEKLSQFQVVSVAFATSAVALLALGLGELPIISLVLGVTFGFYGLIKKRLNVDALTSVCLEISILLPFAILYLSFHYIISNSSSFAYPSFSDLALFIMSGILTGLPLFLFSMAASLVRYSTIGIINYLNPTFQFLVAVFIFVEPFGTLHWISFAFIWLSLLIYSFEILRLEVRKSSKTSSTDLQTLK